MGTLRNGSLAGLDGSDYSMCMGPGPPLKTTDAITNRVPRALTRDPKISLEALKDLWEEDAEEGEAA